MGDRGDEPFDPTADEERAVGREMVDDSTGLGSVMAHAYRGEIDRVGTWRERLDQTTTWAVTLLAAILTWAFSSPDNPHYILLIGMVVTSIFLGIETRRYRDFDLFRARVRLLQQNLFATALDPSQGVEHEDWRVQLSEDYHTPTLKVSISEALAHRLRRVYLALLGVIGVAWVVRVTAFAPREDWLTTAAVGQIPGAVVITAVAVFYVALLVITFWPRERRAKGEFREGDAGEWKESER